MNNDQFDDGENDARFVLSDQSCTCRQCGGSAEWWELGHLYKMHCNKCSYEETGMFSPSMLDMPSAKLIEMHVDVTGLPPTSANLLALSKLHKRFIGMRPAQLKATYLAGSDISFRNLSKDDAERIESLATMAGFSVRWSEQSDK